MKTNFFTLIKGMILVAMVMTGVDVWGEVVTYTVSSKTEVTTSGTAPSGSSATYSQTYNTKCQMTGGNSATLTLSGYAGYKITGIKLSMKSNSKEGKGTFSAIAGNTTLAAISTATTFNQWYNNTEYSTSYKDIYVTMNNSNYTIGYGENVVIKISATANSLYIESYTITYEKGAALSSIAISGELNKTSYIVGDDFDYSGLTLTGTYSDNTTADLTSSATWTVTPQTLTTSTTSVTVKASYGDKEVTKECAVTVNEKTTVSWDLTKNSYESNYTPENVRWVSSVASMSLAKTQTSEKATHGFSNDYTAFYKDQLLSITPATRIKINNVVFTCTENSYATSLVNSKWENTSKTEQNLAYKNIVTVTPTDGTKAITCTIGAATHVTNVEISYSYTTAEVTLGANGYSTYASEAPFVVQSGKAYYATYNAEQTVVTLHEITDAIAAGEGIIFKGNNAGDKVTIRYTATANAIDSNVLKGVVSSTTEFASGTNYVLSTNSSTHETAFVKMATGKTVTDMSGKAYLNMPSSGAKTVIYFDDEAAGIAAIENKEATDGTAYNIVGQRVDGKARGLVIINGRKYINR